MLEINDRNYFSEIYDFLSCDEENHVISLIFFWRGKTLLQFVGWILCRPSGCTLCLGERFASWRNRAEARGGGKSWWKFLKSVSAGCRQQQAWLTAAQPGVSQCVAETFLFRNHPQIWSQDDQESLTVPGPASISCAHHVKALCI